MFKKIALAILAFIGVILVYAAFRSPHYMVSREIAINAPVEKIFPYLNNMKLGDQWGPWMAMDPATTMTHAGPDEGVGAKTLWTGGKQMGTGSATIVESVTNERVGIKIEYTEPMGMVQDSQYLVKKVGEQSIVTWKVEGDNNFIGRVMCTFINMDKMVGGMFEKGLSNLKNLVETGS